MSNIPIINQSLKDHPYAEFFEPNPPKNKKRKQKNLDQWDPNDDPNIIAGSMTVQEINNSILVDAEFLVHLARQDDVDMQELKILMDKLSILLMGISYE